MCHHFIYSQSWHLIIADHTAFLKNYCKSENFCKWCSFLYQHSSSFHLRHQSYLRDGIGRDVDRCRTFSSQMRCEIGWMVSHLRKFWLLHIFFDKCGVIIWCWNGRCEVTLLLPKEWKFKESVSHGEFITLLAVWWAIVTSHITRGRTNTAKSFCPPFCVRAKVEKLNGAVSGPLTLRAHWSTH